MERFRHGPRVHFRRLILALLGLISLPIARRVRILPGVAIPAIRRLPPTATRPARVASEKAWIAGVARGEVYRDYKDALPGGRRHQAVRRKEAKARLADIIGVVPRHLQDQRRLESAASLVHDLLASTEPEPAGLDGARLLGTWLLQYPGELPLALRKRLTQRTLDNMVDMRVELTIGMDGATEAVAAVGTIFLQGGENVTVSIPSRRLVGLDDTLASAAFGRHGDVAGDFIFEVIYADEDLLVSQQRGEAAGDGALFQLGFQRRLQEHTIAVWRRIVQSDTPRWSVADRKPAEKHGRLDPFAFGLVHREARSPLVRRAWRHHARDRSFIAAPRRSIADGKELWASPGGSTDEPPQSTAGAEKRDAVVNAVRALDTLGMDMPRTFQREPNWSIYAENHMLDLRRIEKHSLRFLRSVLALESTTVRGLRSNQEFFGALRQLRRRLVQWDKIIVKPMLSRDQFGNLVIECLWNVRLVIRRTDLEVFAFTCDAFASDLLSKWIFATEGGVKDDADDAFESDDDYDEYIDNEPVEVFTADGMSRFHLNSEGKIFRHIVDRVSFKLNREPLDLDGTQVHPTEDDAQEKTEKTDPHDLLDLDLPQEGLRDLLREEFAEQVDGDTRRRAEVVDVLNHSFHEFFVGEGDWSIFTEDLELRLELGDGGQFRLFRSVIPINSTKILGLKANKRLTQSIKLFLDALVDTYTVGHVVDFAYDYDGVPVIESEWGFRLQMVDARFPDWAQAVGDELLTRLLWLHFKDYDGGEVAISVEATSRFYLNSDNKICKHVIRDFRFYANGEPLLSDHSLHMLPEDVERSLKKEYGNDADAFFISSGKVIHYLSTHVPNVLKDELPDWGLLESDLELDLRDIGVEGLHFLHEVSPLSERVLRGLNASARILGDVRRFVSGLAERHSLDVLMARRERPGSKAIHLRWRLVLSSAPGAFRDWLAARKDRIFGELMERRLPPGFCPVILNVWGTSAVHLSSDGKIDKLAVYDVEVDISTGAVHPHPGGLGGPDAQMWTVVSNQLMMNPDEDEDLDFFENFSEGIAFHVEEKDEDVQSQSSGFVGVDPVANGVPARDVLEEDIPELLRREPRWSIYEGDVQLDFSRIEPALQHMKAAAWLPAEWPLDAGQLKGLEVLKEAWSQCRSLADAHLAEHSISAVLTLQNSGGLAIIRVSWKAKLRKRKARNPLKGFLLREWMPSRESVRAEMIVDAESVILLSLDGRIFHISFNKLDFNFIDD